MIFFLENRAVYEIMGGKNIIERGRPQMTKNGAGALRDGYHRLQIHTQVV
jgi:hypothetical protein